MSRLPTRQRILTSALELFSSQGIANTTTKQIADRAQINEVTLFRHFGSKHGLLLAVLNECLGRYLHHTDLEPPQGLNHPDADLQEFLTAYILNALRTLQNVQGLLRSLVGESAQYPPESREAIAQGIVHINAALAQRVPLSTAKFMHQSILGYIVLWLTADIHPVWSNESTFVQELVAIALANQSITQSTASGTNGCVSPESACG